MTTRLLPVLPAIALAAVPLSAQEGAPAHVPIPIVEARAEDVASLDGIVAAFYDVISGPVGQPRDWGRDATLYLDPMFFTVAAIDPQTGAPTARTVSKQDWIDDADAWLVENGFVERELHRETRRFGNVAQVWSTYEWSVASGETGRGINGIHLYHDGARWWITHATWDAEREGNPIPPEYLP